MGIDQRINLLVGSTSIWGLMLSPREWCASGGWSVLVILARACANTRPDLEQILVQPVDLEFVDPDDKWRSLVESGAILRLNGEDEPFVSHLGEPFFRLGERQ